jgi:hypothetical protein
MNKEERSYFFLLLLHAFIGVFIFVLPFMAKMYSLFIFVYGVIYIIKSKNKNNEALLLCAYVVSVEVLLRMTDGMILNEYAKYVIIIFLFLGIIYSGFSKNAFWYWLFLFLLVPSIILSTITLNADTDIRKAIMFNVSGPFCLGISAIYCYQRKITFERLNSIITAFCLPLISLLTYLFLYTPSVKEAVTSTQSNFETSGGFGPNQVSTILGLGIFVFFSQLLLNSTSKKLKMINGFFVLFFAFRGVVTFSRGGVFTSLAMIFVFLLVLYFKVNLKGKAKLNLIIVFSVLASLGVWTYSSMQTNGLINKRYANEDANGREKKSQLSGREDLIESELNMFFDNPILGIGVGKNKEYRLQKTGIEAASHNEITRMLAEHGSLGLLALIILFWVPLFLYFINPQNVLALSFFVFWGLTINHAAMRLAAPAFIYALSLLKVYNIEKPSLHRE